MLSTTDVIVLDAVRYSDTASIVHVYSREFGPLHLKVSRASRHKAGGTRAFFTPFSLLSVTLDFRPKKEVQVPWESRLLYCPSCISADPAANAVALFLTELLFRLLRSEEPDEALFDLLKEEIEQMDGLTTGELANFHLVLLLRMLPLLGILPATETYRPGYVLSVEEGRFIPPVAEYQKAEAPSAAMMMDMLSSEEPLRVPLSRDQRQALLRFLLRYYSCHFPSVSDLRSPDILAALFS